MRFTNHGPMKQYMSGQTPMAENAHEMTTEAKEMRFFSERLANHRDRKNAAERELWDARGEWCKDIKLAKTDQGI